MARESDVGSSGNIEFPKTSVNRPFYSETLVAASIQMAFFIARNLEIPCIPQRTLASDEPFDSFLGTMNRRATIKPSHTEGRRCEKVACLACLRASTADHHSRNHVRVVRCPKSNFRDFLASRRFVHACQTTSPVVEL